MSLKYMKLAQNALQYAEKDYPGHCTTKSVKPHPMKTININKNT